MTWLTEGRAIGERITGLLEAGAFFYQACAVNSEDSYNMADNYLSAEARRIFKELIEYRDQFKDNLPPNALKAIKRYVALADDVVQGEGVKGLPGVKARLTQLAALRSELAFCLSDRSEIAHRLSERAFQHIQRTIIADENARRAWMNAFKQGEVACEKLGSVHLLQHGLWAFKVSGNGEATDLVFSEPVNLRNAESAAEAIVLTEWKIVRDQKDVDGQATQARKQAQRYGKSVLGGLELQAYRYLVLVSPTFVKVPNDSGDNEVLYRHVNIAVDPPPPSKS